MARLLVLYNTPTDPEAFQRYYHETHIPLAKKVPGLTSAFFSNGPVTAVAGDAPYLVASLCWASMADLQSAMDSPEGKAAAADLQNFATGGATLLVFDEKTE